MDSAQAQHSRDGTQSTNDRSKLHVSNDYRLQLLALRALRRLHRELGAVRMSE
jgi:hypothetical protein